MGVRIHRLWRGLTIARVETDPGATDPRLLGRTYAIPFEQVWRAALAIPGALLRRWRVLDADDGEGVIRMYVLGAGLFRFASEITLHIGLDENAQTRVDAASRSDRGRDFGANARRVASFFTALDQRLNAEHAPVVRASDSWAAAGSPRPRRRQSVHES